MLRTIALHINEVKHTGTTRNHWKHQHYFYILFTFNTQSISLQTDIHIYVMVTKQIKYTHIAFKCYLI